MSKPVDLRPLADGEVITTAAARINVTKRFHTDPDCRYVDETKTPRIRRRDRLGDDWQECARCAGTVERDGDRDWSAYRLASNADPSEVLDDA